MSDGDFRILLVNLASGRGDIQRIPGRDRVAGGSGLAALLFERFADPGRPWDHPEQPLIFAIGPLTGAFPLMSKTVCGFKSPYHDQYAESHAGGRSALALRFAGLDALVLTGRAPRPSYLVVGSRRLELRAADYLWGEDVQTAGKRIRRMLPGSGHRSIWRIGTAGENRSAIAGINVDTYRHFGRLGAGGVMGAKQLKAVAVIGDGHAKLPEGKAYRELFDTVYQRVTATDMMAKYHNLGTAENLKKLNTLRALPWHNLQRTHHADIEKITGTALADRTLLRNGACSGCPVGCIHIGFVREKFMAPNQYLYRKVAYDYEPVFAMGTMLGVTDPFAVLALLDRVEKTGLDVMSAGVALAWATEALEKSVVTTAETLVPLAFGDAAGYAAAVAHLGQGGNRFYRTLARGLPRTVAAYGGRHFACLLGQEMAGYATGEVFFASQALGLRHSHLDSGGYGFDQQHPEADPSAAVAFLVDDERDRCLLTAMVACLFARRVYDRQLLGDCLAVLGYPSIAGDLERVAAAVQRLRWRMRLATGFDPSAVRLPDRFTQVTTWKGPVDGTRLEALLAAYAERIANLGRPT
jgi:aldehyde:ferredoxin oxidoreductase